MPTQRHRARLARDGIFNVRDLGGTPLRHGRVVAHRRVLRADALHRAKASAQVLHELGVVRVLDLRDDTERDEEGVLLADGLEVQHHPVIDPMFAWDDDAVDDLGDLLRHRYREILTSFGPRFATALTAIADVVDRSGPGDGADPGSGGSAVAYHCAVGKDRTGLLSALLLGLLGASEDAIAADYARSSSASAVQVSWLWALGHPDGRATDDDLAIGLWSARPDTMHATLGWLASEFGGVHGYLHQSGMPAEVGEKLCAALVVSAANAGGEQQC